MDKRKGMYRMTFGFTEKNIKVIESHISKWEGAKFDKNTWDAIGKEIGWHPLSAALWYLRGEYDWKSFDKIIPVDGMRIEAWHKLWKCVISVKYTPEYDPSSPWMCITKTNCWPSEAFSHYRLLSEVPQEGEKDGNT